MELVHHFVEEDAALRLHGRRSTPHLHEADVRASRFGACPHRVHARGDPTWSAMSTPWWRATTPRPTPRHAASAPTARPSRPRCGRSSLERSPSGLFWDWPGDTEIVPGLPPSGAGGAGGGRRRRPTAARRSSRRPSDAPSSSGSSGTSPSAQDSSLSASAGLRASTGPWRYVPTTRPSTAPSLPSPPPLPTPAVTRPRGSAPSRERGGAPVVLEAGERRAASRAPVVHLGEHLAHGPRARALHRVDLEEADTLVGLAVGPGKAPPDDLEPRAHRQHHGAPRHAPGERPVVDERPRGADLGAVLPPAQAVDVCLGEGTVGGRLQELDGEAAPFRPPGQHQPVPAVAVGAEQVGVDHRDAQRSDHLRTRPAGRGTPCSCR